MTERGQVDASPATNEPSADPRRRICSEPKEKAVGGQTLSSINAKRKLNQSASTKYLDHSYTSTHTRTPSVNVKRVDVFLPLPRLSHRRGKKTNDQMDKGFANTHTHRVRIN